MPFTFLSSMFSTQPTQTTTITPETIESLKAVIESVKGMLSIEDQDTYRDDVVKGINTILREIQKQVKERIIASPADVENETEDSASISERLSKESNLISTLPVLETLGGRLHAAREVILKSLKSLYDAAAAGTERDHSVDEEEGSIVDSAKRVSRDRINWDRGFEAWKTYPTWAEAFWSEHDQ